MSQSILKPEQVTEKQIIEIYNSFNPFNPLEPGDRFYVDCHEVRGNENILKELGKRILRSKPPTYQLYTGHRGVGKSTELKRLKENLESEGCRVIYFAADEDIDEQDAQYTDILLACTRYILDDLKDLAKVSPLVQWLRSRWQELKDLALTEVTFENLELEAQIALFAKLTATLRQVPNSRQKIREQVDTHSVSLINALNDLIEDAKSKLDINKLVVIVDNLDRIVPVLKADGRTNHDEIFIDRSGQLRRLNCHVIYTVPISLVYSNRASTLKDNYGDIQVLPMIQIKNRDDSNNDAGLAKMQELISRRVELSVPGLPLIAGLVDTPGTLHKLCLGSGGHLREMMQVIQSSFDWVDQLPLTINQLEKAMGRARSSYRVTVDEEDWPKLATVALSKQLLNEDEYRNLLFSRCVLEYREENQQCWHDVHPLLKEVPEFIAAFTRLKVSQANQT